ncbi:glycosyltransferase family 39 protein, partial [Frankia sp. CN4]
PGAARRRRLAARVALGPADDPRWARPALLALLAATAVLYLWGLGRSGWANAFYSAAAQAGSESWKALFYGSSDAGNSITVDKPPVAMWVMGLSARIFGVSSWSILVPEALAGVASVGLLHAAVRRAFSPAAGLLAGLVLATTPVAVLMFRFNNPDAVLVLLLVGAAYAALRAVEGASGRWLALAGVLVGFAFLTKMMQAFLIVPVLALVYLVVAPTGLGRRVRHVLLAGLALVASAGWYIAVVELVPASARPYIGGSQHNSLLELTLGYNGFGRLTGDEVGSVGGGGAGGRPGGAGQVFGPPANGGGWGETGWGRLFNAEIGGQVAWLLPAALALLVAGLWVTRRAARTDRARAAFLVWGGWLVVTGAVFSQMQGIFHAYYTVALAPAIGALVGMGAVTLWERRREPAAAGTLAVVTGGTVIWCAKLLGRSPDWQPWLRPTVLAVGLAAAVALAGLPWLIRRAEGTGPDRVEGAAGDRAEATRTDAVGGVAAEVSAGADPESAEAASPRSAGADPAGTQGLADPTGPRRTPAGPIPRPRVIGRVRADLAGLTVAGVSLAACLLGPTSYALATADTPHTGALPSAGPSTFGGGRFVRLGGGPGGVPGGFSGQGQAGQGQQGQGQPGQGQQGQGQAGQGQAGQGPWGQGQPGQGQPGLGQGQPGQGGGFSWPGGGTGGLPPGLPGAPPSGGQGGSGFTGGRPGGMGGLLGAPEASADVVALLEENSSAYTWAAATVGSNNAAGYQLAARVPVMAIGGFNGTDPAPTLAQFQEYVADGRIHYFIGGGLSGSGNGGSQEAADIAAWVEENFTATTVDGATLYDLTVPASAGSTGTASTSIAT